MAAENEDRAAEEMFDKALAVAERHLAAAQEEGGALGDFVAVAMIESAVNVAVDAMGGDEVAAMLRDLAEQIEADEEDAANDQGGDED